MSASAARADGPPGTRRPTSSGGPTGSRGSLLHRPRPGTKVLLLDGVPGVGKTRCGSRRDPRPQARHARHDGAVERRGDRPVLLGGGRPLRRGVARRPRRATAAAAPGARGRALRADPGDEPSKRPRHRAPGCSARCASWPGTAGSSSRSTTRKWIDALGRPRSRVRAAQARTAPIRVLHVRRAEPAPAGRAACCQADYSHRVGRRASEPSRRCSLAPRPTAFPSTCASVHELTQSSPLFYARRESRADRGAAGGR